MTMSAHEKDAQETKSVAKTVGWIFVAMMTFAGALMFFDAARNNDPDRLNLTQAQAQCVEGGGQVSVTSGLFGKSYFCKGEDGIIRELSMRRI